MARGSNASIDSKKYRAGHKSMSDGDDSSFDIEMHRCAGCNRVSITLDVENEGSLLLWPRFQNRGVGLAYVPSELVKDYQEAVAVLGLSPNASAALSRRTLQTLLILQGAKKQRLDLQIKEMEASFPSWLRMYVDKIRHLGNLAAHASEDKVTAQILDVDPEEADWILLLLEGLFDHYYTSPAVNQAKMDAVEIKLNRKKRLRP